VTEVMFLVGCVMTMAALRGNYYSCHNDTFKYT